MSSNLYDDLGVDPGATPEEIKAAHRKSVKRTHPDRVGDSGRAEFERVQRAYLVLASPEKRARYDQTGKIDDSADNQNPMIAAMIRAAFQQALAVVQDQYGRYDLIELTRKNLQAMRQSAVQDALISRDLMPMKEDLLGRLQLKQTTRFDPIGGMIRDEIKSLKAQEEMAMQGVAGIDAAIAHLDHYGFVFEPIQPVASYSFYTSAAGV